MSKVFTDPSLIEEFLNRGVDNVYPDKNSLRKKLESGEKIVAYQGFDPTGPYLHVGHAMGIRALRILQKLGHKVIFLVGDFTSRIGDPDKEETRDLLTEAQVNKNKEGWKKQASQLIDFKGNNPVEFRHNYEWLSKIKLEELITLMSKATVQQMLERDLFQRRIHKNNPIGLQEFIYPLMQGYDSVAMNVDLEIGGTDQIFNMLVGRQLCKQYLNKEKFVRANILMEAPDALTMSKTKGNGINLSDSSIDMYGKAMSYKDEFIIKALTLLTEMPLGEIDALEIELKNTNTPMKYKKIMAREIVKTIKGEKEAISAEHHFEKTVQNKEAPSEIEEITLKENLKCLDIATVVAQNKYSNSEIKRLISQGGFEIDGEKVTDLTKICNLKNGSILKLGKRNYVKVKIH